MVNGVKLFTDGALGTFTAALTVPYLTGKTGILLMEDNVLADKFYNYMQLGIPLAVHAIGDRAVKQVAGTVSLLRRESGCSGPVRIEHAQFISRDDAFTAKDAGIGLSMQPNFSLDSVMYSDRLPRGYPALNNPFRMLIDEAGFIPGMDLLFGSDGMPHGMLPALRSALFPPFAGQVLTLQEFKDGYCIPGAGNEWLVHIDNGHVKISRL
jgi:predicted amidohydrolase YtcJ